MDVFEIVIIGLVFLFIYSILVIVLDAIVKWWKRIRSKEPKHTYPFIMILLIIVGENVIQKSPDIL